MPFANVLYVYAYSGASSNLRVELDAQMHDGQNRGKHKT